MSCARVQQRMSVALMSDLPRVELLEVEAHAARCRHCADALADLRATAVALSRAYAPLRSATIDLSPDRARLAARAPLPAPLAVRVARLTTRVSEIALAAAVTAFAFVGAASVAPRPAVVGDEQAPETLQLTRVTTRLDDATFARWLRLDRYVPPDDTIDPTAALPAVARASDLGEGSGRIH